jgi:glycosyltransferase involved in cell wall biosynthesis
MTADLYKRLEDRFRGESSAVREKLRFYLPFLEYLDRYAASNLVVDLGCGRGEWLELASACKVRSVGVDLDQYMLSVATAKGLEVIESDVISFLKRQSSESIGLITAFHLVEHLRFDDLLSLLEECFRCLAPGGVMIMETPNPENIYVSTIGFYIDPTHVRPIPPVLLTFLVEEFGFQRANTLRLNEDTGVLEKLEKSLSDVIYGVSPDYCVIAQKAGYNEISQISSLFSEEVGVDFQKIAYDYDLNWRILSKDVEALKLGLSKAEQRIDQLEKNIDQMQERADQAIEKFEFELKKFGGAVKEQGEWTLDFSMRHAKVLEELSVRMARIERYSIIKFFGYLSLKTNELYWTITRALGFAHLHDGSRGRHETSDNLPVKEKYIFFPLKNESAEVNFAFIKLKAAIDFFRDTTAETLPASNKKKLAFVTPFPPQKTGIADYSCELLPYLDFDYDVYVIVENSEDSISSIVQGLKIRDSAWFERHAYDFDRIIYQVGNSEYHAFMISLSEKYPGIVIMHDFFLGHFIGWADGQVQFRGIWTNQLYNTEGYNALLKRFGHQSGETIALQECPVNVSFFVGATGILFHSEYALQLAYRFFGKQVYERCRVVPHGRDIPSLRARSEARASLGIGVDEFVVCSFGFVSENKRSREIFRAWTGIRFVDNKPARLIFVGEKTQSPYSEILTNEIKEFNLSNVSITGYVSRKLYLDYLAACDVAIQLRCNSRGETSGATLDCLAAGITTIVSEYGPFAEIPDECVIKVEDRVEDKVLTALLEGWINKDFDKRGVGVVAQHYVKNNLSFESIGNRISFEIERFYAEAKKISDISFISGYAKSFLKSRRDVNDILPDARQLSKNIGFCPSRPQLLIDISALVNEDLNSGVQRVVKEQLSQLLVDATLNYRVEPIYLENSEAGPVFRYANQFTLNFLNLPELHLAESVVSFSPDDIYYMPDLCYSSVITASSAGLYSKMREIGVRICFLVFDNLPLSMPERFPEGAKQAHEQWLRDVCAHSHRLICISHAVKRDVVSWIHANDQFQVEPSKFGVVHLGGDFRTRERLDDRKADVPFELTEILRSKITFLMVGTIEPRKGHMQVIEAFDCLKSIHDQINLVIVGGEGWQGMPDEQRRNIPEIVDRLREHGQLGKNLFWLNDVKDDLLGTVYQASSCLIMASEGEGFGLPAVEAAQYGLDIIARDIPVFRELMDENAFFFDGSSGRDLAETMLNWIELSKSGKAPSSAKIRFLTWSQSADLLKKELLGTFGEM